MTMTEAGCAVQAACGGCPLLPLDRSIEIATKVNTVSAALAAVGIDIAIEFDEEPPRFGYRNRLRMKVEDGRADFFNQAKRDGCPVVRPDLWAAIEQLRQVTARGPNLLGQIEYLEVRVGDDGAFGLCLPALVELEPLWGSLGPDWAIACSGTEHPPTLRYTVAAGVSVDVPVTSFVQVNSEVNRKMVGKVLAVAKESGAASFLDLFSGAGNFAVPLAAQGLIGFAVDNAGAAIAELGRSVPASEGRIRCIEGDARTISDQLEPVDFVVADPPRAGVQENHRQLADLVADTLVLIGCKASAFAADVAALCSAGLVLESVTVFDMFPGTKHVETLAVLNKGGPTVFR